MALPQQNGNSNHKTSPQYQLGLIATARGALLGTIILSTINLLMLALDTGRYFLFSISVPYYLTWFGKILDNGTSDGSGSLVGTYTIMAIVIGLLILTVYLITWLLSKKHRVWLTVATALFVVDTVALIVFAFTMLTNPMSCLLDFLLHAVILF